MTQPTITLPPPPPEPVLVPSNTPSEEPPTREALRNKLRAKCAAAKHKGVRPSRAAVMKQMGLSQTDAAPEAGDKGPANEGLDKAISMLRSELAKKGTKKMLRNMDAVAKKVVKILGTAGPLPSTEPVGPVGPEAHPTVQQAMDLIAKMPLEPLDAVVTE